MNKDIQKIDPKELTMQDVKQYVCPDATEKEIFLFLQIAKSCNLNPFLSQIYLVKYGTQKAQILTSYNVYLQRAERSKKYAGLETSTVGSVKTNDLKAIVKVFRKDWEKPLIHEVYYDEYVQRKKDGSINKFWREKPRTMIVKVAISQAFRLAFPLDFEGMPYTQDEMNTLETPLQIEKTTVSMPEAIATEPTSKVKQEVIEPENDELPKNEDIPEEAEIVESGTITKEKAKELVSIAKKNEYTESELYKIIGLLNYVKIIDILEQDYDTIMQELSRPATEYRAKQAQIQAEQDQIDQKVWDE